MSDDVPSSRPRALLPDLAPWRTSADFRRLWVAGLVTSFGSFLTFVALPVHTKVLTGSAAAVGAIGAVELIPMVVFGLYGGALADALDKRKLILWTETGQGLLCAGLLVNATVPHPAVWPLYGVAALSAALTSVRASVWAGGALCVGAVWLLAAGLPKLMSYDDRTNEHALRMRSARAEDFPPAPPVTAS